MTSRDAQARAAFAYNAAADAYDHPANSFWSRFGRKTVERLRLRVGDQVLDVCCGSGASAIPAAEAVGPDGHVIGIDLAENLLQRARAKAADRGLRNTDFRVGDMLDLDAALTGDANGQGTFGGFDAVICVFGIFFVPDMHQATAALWRKVRPGGVLAITTWGPRFFEPANALFWDAVRSVRPDLYKGFSPWDRISLPDAVCGIFPPEAAGSVVADAERATHVLGSPEDFWTAALGSGYRGTLEQMDGGERALVREQTLRHIQDADIREIEANVVYAVAKRTTA